MTLHRSIVGAVLAALLLYPAGANAQVATVSPGPCPAPACSAPIASSQLQNIGQLQDEVTAYYKNGSYDAEVSKIEADASNYIDKRVAAGVKKPALVLDIDDTALLTLGYELKTGFGYSPDQWNAYALQPGFPAIAETLALAKHAQSQGVAVFFITGRRSAKPDLTALTAKNLAGVGYTYTHLYLRPAKTIDHAPSVVPFKSKARAAIERLGYTVLETIGDQWSDLEGGHAERAYKLPNPMYFVP
jgi:predicted secreted acid phosphatase